MGRFPCLGCLSRSLTQASRQELARKPTYLFDQLTFLKNCET